MEILFIQLSDYKKKTLMTGFVVQGHVCVLWMNESFGFGTTWVWVNDKRISFLAVNMHMRCFRENVMKSFTEMGKSVQRKQSQYLLQWFCTNHLTNLLNYIVLGSSKGAFQYNQDFFYVLKWVI